MNSEQWSVIEWRGCYPSNWKGVVVTEAMAHPAKFSSKLIRRIYDHMLEENWVQAGDAVVDPFGGVALGALEAMRHGLHWTGVELEERFYKIGNENINKWMGDYGAMLKGSATLLHGDSRFMLNLLAGQTSVVSSPPYAESIKTSDRGSGIDYSKAKSGGKGRTAGRESIATGYGVTAGQLGHMRAVESSYQVAVSSPPFLQSEGGTPEPKAGGVIDARMYARHAAGNKSANGYGESDGQLSSMSDGGFEIAVSSPPYEATTITENRQFRSMSQPDRPSASNLRNEGGDAYGTADGQLGNEIGDDFWLSARAIVEQVYQSLAPGGHACWVTKDYVKSKQIVPFSDKWRQLCEAEENANDGEHCEEGGGAVDGEKKEQRPAVSGQQKADGSGQRASEDMRRLSACVEKMSACFTLEQFEQLAELFVMTKDIAILRESDQSVTVMFNDKGYPRGFNASNNVRPIKPVMYKAE